MRPVTKDKVLTILQKANKPLSVEHISDWLEANPFAVLGHINKLMDEGTIVICRETTTRAFMRYRCKAAKETQ